MAVEVEGIRILINGSAYKWQLVINCCRLALADAVAHDVASLLALPRASVAVRWLSVGSLIVVLTIKHDDSLVIQRARTGSCENISLGTVLPKTLTIFQVATNETSVAAVVQCVRSAVVITPTELQSQSPTILLAPTTSTTLILQGHSTPVLSGTRTISESFSENFAKKEIRGNAGILAETFASMTSLSQQWRCTSAAAAICLLALLLNLVAMVLSLFRRCSSSEPLFELAQSKWLSLTCGHVYVSAVVPCHYRCALIHAQHLTLHLFTMCIVAALLLIQLSREISPISTTVIVFIAAVVPNLWRPIVDFVFYHVSVESVPKPAEYSKPAVESASDGVQPNQVTIEIVETTHDAIYHPQEQLDQFFDDIHVEELNLPQAQVVAVEADLREFQDDDFDLVGLYRPAEEPYSPEGLIGGMRRRHDPSQPFTSEALRDDARLRSEMLEEGADIEDDFGDVGVISAQTLRAPQSDCHGTASTLSIETFDDVYPFAVQDSFGQVDEAGLSNRPKSHKATRRLSVVDEMGTGATDLGDVGKLASDLYGWFAQGIRSPVSIRSPPSIRSPLQMEEGAPDDDEMDANIQNISEPAMPSVEVVSSASACGEKTAVELFEEKVEEVPPVFCPVATSLDVLFASQPTGAESQTQQRFLTSVKSIESSSDDDFEVAATAFWKRSFGEALDSQPSNLVTPEPQQHARVLSASDPCERLRFRKKSEDVDVIRTWHKPGLVALTLVNLCLAGVLWSCMSALDAVAQPSGSCNGLLRILALAATVDMLILQQLVLVLKALLAWLNESETRSGFGEGHPVDGQQQM